MSNEQIVDELQKVNAELSAQTALLEKIVQFLERIIGELED